jgi:hypothetical protein
MPGILDILGALGSNLLGGQAPQQSQQRQPPALPGYGGGDNPLMAGFQNFTQAGSPMGAIGGLITGLTSGQRTDPVGAYQQAANLTYRALLRAGVPDAQAQLAAVNPTAQAAVMKDLFPQWQAEKIGNTIVPFNPAGGQMKTGAAYTAPQTEQVAPGSGLYQTQPLIGGQPIQTAPLSAVPGSRGPMPLPGAGAGDQGGTGAPPMPPSPTATGPAQRGVPMPGEQPGVRTLVPGMSIAEKQAQQTQGTAMGQARANLPKAEESAQDALKIIEQIRNHPGRDAAFATGFWGRVGDAYGHGMLPLPGGPGYDFVKTIDQAKGGAFLTAYSLLRGSGAISNVEGEKATQAMAQLDRFQSAGALNKALDDYRGVIERGLENQRKIARGEMAPYETGGGPGTPGAATAPQSAPPAAAQGAPGTATAGQGAPGGGWTQVNPGIRVRRMSP